MSKKDTVTVNVVLDAKTEPPKDTGEGLLRTPRQWAETLGNVKRVSQYTPQIPELVDWKHACADALHGWSKDAHAYQGEHQTFRLSQEDYQQALEVACIYPNTPPHAAAIPKRG